MKQIDVSDEVYEALKQLTTDFHQAPDDVLAALLNVRVSPALANEPLVAFLIGAEFRAKFTDADRYLAILGWVATKNAEDFNQYIESLASGRRYLGWSREEIIEQCRHNQARQVPGTHFWAIMNIDTATKRRFLARLLEFVGYHDEVIEYVCAAIGMRRATNRRPRPAATAEPA
jgi:negative modulator of initiation of replication